MWSIGTAGLETFLPPALLVPTHTTHMKTHFLSDSRCQLSLAHRRFAALTPEMECRAPSPTGGASVSDWMFDVRRSMFRVRCFFSLFVCLLAGIPLCLTGASVSDWMFDVRRSMFRVR